MQQNQTIRIDINVSDTEIRNLSSIIQDLTDASNNLNSSFQGIQSNLQALGVKASSSSSPFSAQLDIFTNLRNAVFLLSSDYRDLIDDLSTLKIVQSTAALSAQGLKGALNAKAFAAKGATGAITGMTWALKALPFVGITFAVFSLVSSLVRLITNLSSASKAYEDLYERIDQNRESLRNNMRNIDENARSTSRLVDRLLELDSQERRSIRTLRERSAIIAQLNSRNEGLNLTYDAQTGRLTSNSSEIIKNMAARNNLNREVKRSEELYNGLFKQSLDLAAVDLKLDEAIRERDEFNASVDRTTINSKYNDSQMSRLSGTVSRLTAKQSELQAEVYDTERQWQQSLENIDAHIQEHGLTLETLSDTQHEVIDQMVERWNIYQERGTEMFRELGSATKMYTYVQDENGEMVRASLLATAETSEEVLEAMIENMRRNREATQEWSNNLNYIAEEFGADFAGHLRELGPEAAAYVQHMVDGCSDVMEELVEEFHLSGKAASANISKGLDNGHQHIIPILEELVDNSGNSMQAKIEQEFPSIGESIPKEVCKGIDLAAANAMKTAKFSGRSVVGAFEEAITGESRQITTVIKEVLVGALERGTRTAATQAEMEARLSGESIVEGLNAGIAGGASRSVTTIKALAKKMQSAHRNTDEANSPSRVYMRHGGYIVEGLCNGLERMRPQAVRSIQSIARDMQQVYNNSDRTYQNIGRDMINGLNQGLLNGEGQVMSTARRIADNISRTMRDALEINSPSRVMREQIGRFIPEGVAAGIDKYADAAIDSVYKLGNDLINLNLPSVESMIGMGPSMRISSIGAGTYDHSVTHHHHNNSGLFEGATIHWNGEEDIRRTMEKIAWVTQKESARMW